MLPPTGGLLQLTLAHPFDTMTSEPLDTNPRFAVVPPRIIRSVVKWSPAMNLDPKIWFQVFKRDKGRCRYCDADLLYSFSTFFSTTVDHIVARAAKGSDDDPANLVLACPACNSMLSRSTKLVTFEERRAFLDKYRPEQVWRYNELRNELRGVS